MNQQHQIALALDEVERELRALGHWGGRDGRPAAEAFSSTLPFCTDTMELHQWLEYVLIERLRMILANGDPLPARLCVHPMAEESYRGQWAKYRGLIHTLRHLDRCFLER